jgi:hypothetical protein
MRIVPRPARIHRTAIVLAVFSLTLAGAGTAAASASGHPGPGSVLYHHATINTYRAWDGASSIAAFGNPDTSTYGEIITIPDDKTTLKRFDFPMANFDGAIGSLVLRGEVYAWDGQEATGDALWESAPRTIAFDDDAFHREAFHTGGVAVTPGAQYIVFASISKDYDQCTPGYYIEWGSVQDDAYPDGSFAFLNDTGDPSQWTTVPWTTGFGIDLVLRVVLT